MFVFQAKGKDTVQQKDNVTSRRCYLATGTNGFCDFRCR